MNTYEVTINDSIKKRVCVEANSPEVAVLETERMIADGEILLHHEDYNRRRTYHVSRMESDFGVVTKGTKFDWIRTVLSLNRDEDLTLRLNKNLFLWIERYDDGRSDSGADTLLIELNKGHLDCDDGECISVFDEVLENYEIDFNSIKVIVDTLLDIFDAYVGVKLSSLEVVGGLVGTAIATSLFAVFGIITACL